MIISQLNTSADANGPLADVAKPICLDDVAMQMEMLADDGADMTLCHIEADRLLLSALKMLVYSESQDTRTIDVIIEQFNRIKKIYE